MQLHTRSLWVFMILALMQGRESGAGQDVKTSAESAQGLSKLGRYAWQQNHIVARQTPETVAAIEQALKKAINRELTHKGYVEDLQAPDFLVRVDAGPDFDTDVSANKDFRLPADATVYKSQTPLGPGVSAWLVVISRIRIIMTHPGSDTPAWQAEATKKYKDPDKAIKNLDKEVGQIVSKALRGFPPRKMTS